MTPEEFREIGHALVDWVADYRAKIAARPVMSRAKPGEVRAAMPASPPEQPTGFATVAEDLERIVMPGITHWAHPRFFAYFPSNASLSSVLADLVVTGLGVQGMSWQTSPAATEIEEVTMEWLRQMIGLPASFTGVLHDTASTATLVALLSARERTTQMSQLAGGLAAAGAPLVVYASDQAHSSIEKAVRLAGFGLANLRSIPTDDDFAMRADLLARAVAEDRAAGARPCAIVATVGTTATTAVDPVDAIGQLAEREGLWLHVDAAMGGSAMILPEMRVHWRGIERADSLVWNPHKWLGAAFDCSAYYVRDPEHLVRVMSTSPSYLVTEQDGVVKNLRDWGLPLGRRFRSMKLWFLLREHGVAGLRARLQRDLDNARWLAAEVDRARPDGWERVAPVHFQTVALRHVPNGRDAAAIDAHNLALARAVNKSGRAYVTPAIVRGRQIVRVSIGAEATERGDVEAVWAALREEAARS